FALDANELAARVATLLEPVRIHEAQTFVVGVLQDRFRERFMMHRRQPIQEEAEKGASSVYSPLGRKLKVPPFHRPFPRPQSRLRSGTRLALGSCSVAMRVVLPKNAGLSWSTREPVARTGLPWRPAVPDQC